MRTLLLAIYLLFSTAAPADDSISCVDGKIRYVENKKEVVVNDRYCFDTVLKSLSSTKKCPNGCLVDSSRPIVLKREQTLSSVESPPFKICRLADGTPQEVEYWAQNKWIKTSRCLFNDGSYQDIERLISSRVKYED